MEIQGQIAALQNAGPENEGPHRRAAKWKNIYAFFQPVIFQVLHFSGSYSVVHHFPVLQIQHLREVYIIRRRATRFNTLANVSTHE